MQRSILTRELNQVDEMRNNLTALAKSLEDDVVHHYVRLLRLHWDTDLAHILT